MSKPIPEVSDLTRPFWSAADAGELRMQKCSDCGHIRFPTGPVCTECLSTRSEWVAVSRHGTVLSHLVFHRGYGGGWNDEVPYSCLFVQLPEGPRMFLDLLDPDREYIERDLVGERVDIVFEPAAEGISVPRAVRPGSGNGA